MSNTERWINIIFALILLFAAYSLGVSTHNETRQEQEADIYELQSCIEQLQETRKEAINSLDNIYSLDVEYGDFIPYFEITGYSDEAINYLEDDPLECPEYY